MGTSILKLNFNHSHIITMQKLTVNTSWPYASTKWKYIFESSPYHNCAIINDHCVILADTTLHLADQVPK